MNRLDRFNSIASSGLVSKSHLFRFPSHVVFKAISWVAGLYKPTTVSLEHALILSSLTGVLAVSDMQLHGKRQKRTVSLSVKLAGTNLWPALSKFIYELLPRIGDFRTPKVHRPSLPGNYSLRIREKLSPLVDFEDLASQSMLESYRGVYLPLSVHLDVTNKISPYLAEHYLRMFRLPFQFYRKHPAPAFDDLAQFS